MRHFLEINQLWPGQLSMEGRMLRHPDFCGESEKTPREPVLALLDFWVLGSPAWKWTEWEFHTGH